jgi:hypothetical protein
MPHVHLTFQSRTRAGRGQPSILIAGLVAATVLACGKERPFATGEVSLQPDRESPSEAVGDASVPNPAVAADCTNVGCPQPLTCDPSLRRCVECLTSANCVSADAPLCDTATQSCVRCLTSTDCPSAAPICKLAATEREANRCVECTSDTECPDARPACDPNTSACTARCTTSAQCNPPTPVCNEQTQTCVGCLADRDCVDEAGVGRSCRPDDTRCVECLSDAQCSDDPAASNCSTDGACVACAGDEDCSLIQGRSACLPSIGCVECVDATDCAGSTRGPVCKASNAAQAAGDAPVNTCVECSSNEHCQSNAGASLCQNNQCVPCVEDADCAGADSNGSSPDGIDLNVCDAGICVQCTGENRIACGGNVCNSLTKQCTLDRPARTAGLCDACVSDFECAEDARCVRQGFGGMEIGLFCHPLPVGTPPSCVPHRPFVEQVQLSTVDSLNLTSVCILRRTTCPGLDAATEDCSEDADCGAANVEDGLCVASFAGGDACALPCISELDCNPDVDCTIGGTCAL